MKDKVKVKECRTMQEAKTYMDSKGATTQTHTELKKELKNAAKGKEVGFGAWGIPNYLLKADSGKYSGDK